VVQQVVLTYRFGGQGAAVVRRGGAVSAWQVLATIPHDAAYTVIDVSWELGLRSGDIDRVMVKASGDVVSKGEILAELRSPLPFLKDMCRSPVSGTLSHVVGDWAVIDTAAPGGQCEVRAMLPGRIISIDKGASVAVESMAMVFDVTSTMPRDVAGRLRVIGASIEEAPSGLDLDVGEDAVILALGGIVDEESIHRAAEAGAVAVVMGSIDPVLLDLTSRGDLPALVGLEGYGSRPMSAAAFDMLRASDGAHAAITCGVGHSAESIQVLAVCVEGKCEDGILLEDDTLDVVDLREGVRLGDNVRIVRGPFAGVRGVVEEIPSVPVKTQSGYQMDGAFLRVSVEPGGVEAEVPMWVPWANLERVLRGVMPEIRKTH
jgi:hypothetical protein